MTHNNMSVLNTTVYLKMVRIVNLILFYHNFLKLEKYVLQQA